MGDYLLLQCKPLQLNARNRLLPLWKEGSGAIIWIHTTQPRTFGSINSIMTQSGPYRSMLL